MDRAARAQNAEDVVDREVEGQRGDEQAAVLRTDLEGPVDPVDQVGRRPVLDDDPLRLPRRARGVDHVGDVVRRWPPAASGRTGSGRRASRSAGAAAARHDARPFLGKQHVVAEAQLVGEALGPVVNGRANPAGRAKIEEEILVDEQLRPPRRPEPAASRCSSMARRSSSRRRASGTSAISSAPPGASRPSAWRTIRSR